MLNKEDLLEIIKEKDKQINKLIEELARLKETGIYSHERIDVNEKMVSDFLMDCTAKGFEEELKL